MFSKAFTLGSSRVSWNMRATARWCLPRPLRHQRWSPRPRTHSSPGVGRSCPWTSRRRVVLPEPLGPVTSSNSPGATLRLTPFRTAVRPKDFVTPTSLIAGSAATSPSVPGRCLSAPFFWPCASVPFLDARARPVVAGRLPTLRGSRLAHAGYRGEGNVEGCDKAQRSQRICPRAPRRGRGRSLGKSLVQGRRADLRDASRLRPHERDDRSVRRGSGGARGTRRLRRASVRQERQRRPGRPGPSPPRVALPPPRSVLAPQSDPPPLPTPPPVWPPPRP